MLTDCRCSYFVYNNFVQNEVYQKGENRMYNDVKRAIMHEEGRIHKKEIIWDTDLYKVQPKKKVKKK